MKTRDVEWIERYIDGELQGDELAAFEKRLKDEPELAKEYESRKKLAGIWKETAEYEAVRDEISAALQTGHSSYFQRNKTFIISIAASVAVLLGVYLMFFLHTNPIDKSRQLVVSDSVNGHKKVLQFHTDDPDRLATLDVVNDSIVLLFPVNNIIFTTKDPIILKWKSFADRTDTLYISNTSDGFLMKEQIRHHSKDTNIYTVQHLSPGHYYWYFSDTTNKGAFTVK